MPRGDRARQTSRMTPSEQLREAARLASMGFPRRSGRTMCHCSRHPEGALVSVSTLRIHRAEQYARDRADGHPVESLDDAQFSRLLPINPENASLDAGDTIGSTRSIGNTIAEQKNNISVPSLGGCDIVDKYESMQLGTDESSDDGVDELGPSVNIPRLELHHATGPVALQDDGSSGVDQEVELSDKSDQGNLTQVNLTHMETIAQAIGEIWDDVNIEDLAAVQGLRFDSETKLLLSLAHWKKTGSTTKRDYERLRHTLSTDINLPVLSTALSKLRTHGMDASSERYCRCATPSITGIRV